MNGPSGAGEWLSALRSARPFKTGEKGVFMSPGFGVRIGAVVMSIVAALGAAGSVSAQLYDDERRSLDLFPDPIARSPRLLGMGRLTFLFDDRRNRITLWDFAGNPTGVLENDSTSTVELQPTTAAISSLHDVAGNGR